MLYRHNDFEETLVHQCAGADKYTAAYRGESENNMKRIEAEIQRTNITVSQFISSVKQVLKKKGIDYADIIGMTTKEFKEMPVDGLGEMNHSTETLASNFWYTKPCHYQTCYFEKNGVGTNEICEFEFDDDKKGNGYFYFLNVCEDDCEKSTNFC